MSRAAERPCSAGRARRSGRSRRWRAGPAGATRGRRRGPWRADAGRRSPRDRTAFGLDADRDRHRELAGCPGARRTREPRAAAPRGPGRHAGRRRARCRRRRRGRAPARRARGRPEDRCAGPRPQDRPRLGPARASWRRRGPRRPPRALLADARRHGIDARGLLVEPMAEHGVELIVGRAPRRVVRAARDGRPGRRARRGPRRRRDPAGAGHARCGARDARRAPRRCGSWPGFAEAPASIGHAVAELIVGVAAFALDRPDVLEIDLNPVIATVDGAVAVDALVVVDEHA